MGLSPAQWDERRDAGGFGHVGLVESARLLGDALGWTLTDWQHDMVPCRAAGQDLVQGTLETLRGTAPDGCFVDLHFEANAAVDEEYDEIVVDGTPPLKLRFDGGVFGDDATAAGRAASRAGDPEHAARPRDRARPAAALSVHNPLVPSRRRAPLHLATLAANRNGEEGQGKQCASR